MREIKFRAWDIDEKKMVELGPLLAILAWSPLTRRELEAFNLMQYTGLKDKNGVEIYEGDIIRFYDGQAHHWYEVKYSEQDTMYTLRNHGRTWSADRETLLYPSELQTPEILRIPSYYSLSAIEYELEVIGNIYENRELLNDS